MTLAHEDNNSTQTVDAKKAIKCDASGFCKRENPPAGLAIEFPRKDTQAVWEHAKNCNLKQRELWTVGRELSKA